MNRRQFLAGAIAAGFMPVASAWANLSAARWLATAKLQDGRFAVMAIDQNLDTHPVFFSDRRLHGLAVSPDKSHIVAPTRRPGPVLHVFDLSTQQHSIIKAATGRHFYGHDVFSGDGSRLYTTENDYSGERGVIGVYDSSTWQRIAEFPSGGIGPHELLLHPDRHSLVIANGGILTHPETGRQKLNLGDMQPNITRLSLDGDMIATTNMPEGYRDLSLRHIAVDGNGMVYCGMQDQMSRRDALPLVWQWNEQAIEPLDAPGKGWGIFNGYIGSMACTADGSHIYASSPRANRVASWSPAGIQSHHMDDACGLASSPFNQDILMTSGKGQLFQMTGNNPKSHVQTGYIFDNHCTAV